MRERKIVQTPAHDPATLAAVLRVLRARKAWCVARAAGFRRQGWPGQAARHDAAAEAFDGAVDDIESRAAAGTLIKETRDD